MSRFGTQSEEKIRKEVDILIPPNTKKSKATIWKQFLEFCEEKNYRIAAGTSVEEIAEILEDWGFNMKKKNSEDYKESVVKVMWNSTAKQLQEMCFLKFKIKFNPFSDVEFVSARAARDANRRRLQRDPAKRKSSAAALTNDEYTKIIQIWNENEPVGLQRKFFHIISRELAWRGGEGVTAKVDYFVKELDHEGNFTGRIEYNPVFTKTTQGGSKKLADSKWLIRNHSNINECPIRLFEKYMERRGDLTIDRLFVTPNPNWNTQFLNKWYKNSADGKNTISSWLKESASQIGIDIKKVKVTNHSARATAVSSLAKNGVQKQQLISP